MVKIYALYKGEKELASGTVRQIAKKMGVKESTIRYYSSEAHKRKSKNSFNTRCLICLDDE